MIQFQTTAMPNVSLERPPCETRKWGGIALWGRSAQGCKAKSVIMTDEGQEVVEELFNNYFSI
jgi:hypothetical protein